MARVTVEDCVLKIPNRFELVLLASQRAREIGSGAELTIDRDNDKNSVVSLREIADGTIDLDVLNDTMIRNHQKVIEVEEVEEDVIDLMDGEMEVIEDSSAFEAEGMHEEKVLDDADEFNKAMDEQVDAALDAELTTEE